MTAYAHTRTLADGRVVRHPLESSLLLTSRHSPADDDDPSKHYTTSTRTVDPIERAASMHILITGGAGFIGSHLADHMIRHGHRVRALDNLHPQVHGDTVERPATRPPWE